MDLYCGLGGWTEGFLAEGWEVVGFDIERHVYGEHRYPAQLVVQDVLTLHGSQFKHAAIIVASPPCQFFSYVAMPWTRAKTLAAAVRADPELLAKELALFNACFRIQAEASAAAGHHIPMVVENVCGAQKWVGRARWHYGSYYLWGDVPALMPVTTKAQKFNPDGTAHPPGSWFAIADSKNRGAKNPGFRFDGRGGITGKASKLSGEQRAFTPHGLGSSPSDAIKNEGGSWFNVAHNTTSGHGQNPDGRLDGVKIGGGWGWQGDTPTHEHRRSSSKSTARKAASARIAKIPRALARHIAQVYKPMEAVA